jgi:hypothetical protein
VEAAMLKLLYKPVAIVAGIVGGVLSADLQKGLEGRRPGI